MYYLNMNTIPIHIFSFSFGILTKQLKKKKNLPSLYWILKLHLSLQTVLYCWVCQMVLETSFYNINIYWQIINMHSISGQNRSSELQFHQIFKGWWCESDMNSELKKNVIWSAYIHNLSPCIIALKHLTSHNYSPAQSKDKLIIDNQFNCAS